ncbi:type III-B CRISPR-associated protein Cas10/Cmr2 [Insolitispirillum peregrinum]|uniref:type III-B CRISPR-associated protein Cas10/Cmr2 n=1 Tax=Insolitispirillum peregrinum TaxID=80876 RepID=UPI00360D1AE6
MSETDLLTLKLGPVQSFIRQGRRTRDIWAGSFLLAWLSAKAMQAVTNAGGEIDTPILGNDPMWKALRDGGDGPVVATLPNVFAVKVTDADQAQVLAKAAADAVETSWRALAEAVREHFLPLIPAEHPIWRGQIDHFWSLSWSYGSPDAAVTRSHWRFPALPRPDQGGDHCTIMGDYQELSGYVRARGERQRQQDFWAQVQRGIAQKIYNRPMLRSLELGPSERLCAIALVKRLFIMLPPTDLERLIGWQPTPRGGQIMKALRKYPSTAFMAALPWLRYAEKSTDPQVKDALTQYAKAVRDIDEDACLLLAEADTRQNQQAHDPDVQPLLNFDGTLFFADGLERRARELGNTRDFTALGAALQSLQKTIGQTLQSTPLFPGGRRQQKFATASPFHALLRMDGDSLGKLIKDGHKAAISEGLTTFTARAVDIVHAQDGLPIYAGGDDVLAFLPLHRALATADSLRRAYAEAMPEGTTLSGGLVFAHYKIALGTVLDLSMALLNDWAKVKAGRNALAMAVLKPSGETARWVSKWPEDPANSLQNLADSFARDDERSASLIHNLKALMGKLFCNPAIPLDREQILALLRAERQRGRYGDDPQDIEAEIRQLLALCRPDNSTGFDLAPALIAKFMADNGAWQWTSEVDQHHE